MLLVFIAVVTCLLFCCLVFAYLFNLLVRWVWLFLLLWFSFILFGAFELLICTLCKLQCLYRFSPFLSVRDVLIKRHSFETFNFSARGILPYCAVRFPSQRKKGSKHHMAQKNKKKEKKTRGNSMINCTTNTGGKSWAQRISSNTLPELGSWCGAGRLVSVKCARLSDHLELFFVGSIMFAESSSCMRRYEISPSHSSGQVAE